MIIWWFNEVRVFAHFLGTHRDVTRKPMQHKVLITKTHKFRDCTGVRKSLSEV